MLVIRSVEELKIVVQRMLDKAQDRLGKMGDKSTRMVVTDWLQEKSNLNGQRRALREVLNRITALQQHLARDEES